MGKFDLVSENTQVHAALVSFKLVHVLLNAATSFSHKKPQVDCNKDDGKKNQHFLFYFFHENW